MCWSQHHAWTYLLRSGLPLQKSASRVLLFLHLQNPSLVGRRASREILSSGAMHYKDYVSTLMGLTPVTLPRKKVFSLLPFYYCFLLFCFSSSDTLVRLYPSLLYGLLNQIAIESAIFGMARNMMEAVVHYNSCHSVTYSKLIISTMQDYLNITLSEPRLKHFLLMLPHFFWLMHLGWKCPIMHRDMHAEMKNRGGEI